MFSNKKQRISIIVVLIFGILMFYIGTDGFRAFTAETARTNKLIEEQPSLPLVTLEDSLEEKYSFDEFKDKYLFMTFFYTACSTTCPVLNSNAIEVFEQIPDQYLDDIVFLSISFDTERDTPEILERYGGYFDIEREHWRLARVPNDDDLDRLLDDLGVIAIPDGQGDYQHNVAFYLIGRDGHLVDVMDFEDINGAADRIVTALQEEQGG
ncbi:MAG TPA: SCO family protein [Bacillota bacterium]|nr:SCO family protein [Bacillota bacterium]